AMERADDSPRD
ncbi:lysozyme, partial [Escherichia coli 10.0833]